MATSHTRTSIEPLVATLAEWYDGSAESLLVITADIGDEARVLLEKIWPRASVNLALSTAPQEINTQPTLTLCLDLPPAEQREPWAQHLAAHSSPLLLAPSAPDPADLAAWVGALGTAGLLYDPAMTSALGLPDSLFLLPTSLPLEESLGRLTLALHRQERARHALYARAVIDDGRLALISRYLLNTDAALQTSQTQLTHLEALHQHWSSLQGTPGYALMMRAQGLRARLSPPGSRRDGLLEMGVGWARIWQDKGNTGLAHHLQGELSWRTRALQTRVLPRRHGLSWVEIPPLPEPPPIPAHTASVDIIVCVHNALLDVKRCVETLLQETTSPYRLILVDDGSDAPTRDYLQSVAQKHAQVDLLRSEAATGYTFAANRGLRHSHADFVVLLNSDTLLTPGWLDRMIACAQTDTQIGIVGPLSNTASWQSIPEISTGTDWAENPLPPGVSLADWAKSLAEFSGRIYPPMPFLNGFCLLIRRQLIDAIGYFDEERFGAGYGEENDYVLRARKAGWQLALADDTYVYHARSRSYSHERRKQLSDRAGEALAAKHGAAIIDAGVRYCIRRAGALGHPRPRRCANRTHGAAARRSAALWRAAAALCAARE